MVYVFTSCDAVRPIGIILSVVTGLTLELSGGTK
jgi:hypothetical protein